MDQISSTPVCQVPTHWSVWLVLKQAAYFPAVLLGIAPQPYEILTAFMFADIIIGVLRVALLHGPREIKSYRLIAGIVSKMLVLLIPLMVVWAGQGAGIPLLFFAQWVVGALVLAEAYSILGHIHAIQSGKDVQEWDAVVWVTSSVGRFVEVVLKDGHSKDQ